MNVYFEHHHYIFQLDVIQSIQCFPLKKDFQIECIFPQLILHQYLTYKSCWDNGKIGILFVIVHFCCQCVFISRVSILVLSDIWSTQAPNHTQQSPLGSTTM
jgi:hypothetical protein